MAVTALIAEVTTSPMAGTPIAPRA
jgi:hypothetical protein